MTSSKSDDREPSYGGRDRDAWLSARGHELARMGFASAAIEAALLAENQARCVPPLGADNVSRMAHDAVIHATMEDIRRENAFTDFANRPRLLDDGELEQLRPPRFQIEGLFPERAIVLLFAAPGVGKSLLALDWSACIQTSRPWHERQVRSGQVVYVIAEGAPGMPIRMRAWKERNAFNGVAGMDFHDGSFDLSNTSDVDRFVKALSVRRKPDLVVIDTVARCLSGDEDSAKDMGAFVKGAERLRTQLDATVLLLHHPTKRGDGERGSGALRAAVDTVLKLTKAKSSGLLRLEVEKQKDGPIGEEIWMSLAPLTLPDGTSSCVLESSYPPQRREESGPAISKGKAKANATAQILRVLERAPKGLRTSELLRRLPDVNESSFYRALKQLRVDGGVVEHDGLLRLATAVTVTSTGSDSDGK